MSVGGGVTAESHLESESLSRSWGNHICPSGRISPTPSEEAAARPWPESVTSAPFCDTGSAARGEGEGKAWVEHVQVPALLQD